MIQMVLLDCSPPSPLSPPRIRGVREGGLAGGWYKVRRMNTINRSAVVVMLAQPFLDWMHQIDPTSSELTLVDVREEPTIYLTPDCDDEAHKRLREVCREIFENELEGWYTDRGRSNLTTRRSLVGLSFGFLPSWWTCVMNP